MSHFGPFTVDLTGPRELGSKLNQVSLKVQLQRGFLMSSTQVFESQLIQRAAASFPPTLPTLQAMDSNWCLRRSNHNHLSGPIISCSWRHRPNPLSSRRVSSVVKWSFALTNYNTGQKIASQWPPCKFFSCLKIVLNKRRKVGTMTHLKNPATKKPNKTHEDYIINL